MVSTPDQPLLRGKPRAERPCRGADRPIRLVLGDSELSQVYTGIEIEHRPALREPAIDDPSLLRRHLPIGMT